MSDLASEATDDPVDVRRAGTLDDALNALLDRYQQSLFAFLVVFLGDRDLARDCAQETFVRAYQNLRKGRSVNVQWLYKVARNRAIDELRRRKRERVEADPVDNEVADSASESERTIAVRRALLRLSPDDREVLYLAEVDGFTSREIGEMLGARPGTVRMRLLRAHERFRAAFEEAP
jgi:RNA polymerase sigma-70 factor (ECF subfamily)